MFLLCTRTVFLSTEIYTFAMLHILCLRRSRMFLLCGRTALSTEIHGSALGAH